MRNCYEKKFIQILIFCLDVTIINNTIKGSMNKVNIFGPS